MGFRLLGKCPSCGIEDEIVKLPYEKVSHSKVRCGNCEVIWDSWISLCSEQEKNNNKLIPVEVERWGNGVVQVYWPSKREIPCSGLIATVLNSALITKFNLRVCLATEGGVEGRGYELRNCDDNLGLYVDYGESNAVKALDFYEKMLRQLFEEPLSFGNVNFRRGEILWLEDDKKSYNDALIYLFGTLTKTASRKFAEKVLKTKEEIAQNPFSAPYIAGLSDEDITRFFVPPPIH
jgi:hypothetical protein